MESTSKTRKIRIYSDDIKSTVLKKAIEVELDPSDTSIQLKLEKERDGTRPLDPDILVAILTSIYPFSQVIEVLAKIYKKRKDARNRKIIVKSKNGTILTISANASKEEILEFIKQVNDLGDIEDIGVT